MAKEMDKKVTIQSGGGEQGKEPPTERPKMGASKKANHVVQYVPNKGSDIFIQSFTLFVQEVNEDPAGCHQESEEQADGDFLHRDTLQEEGVHYHTVYIIIKSRSSRPTLRKKEL